MYIDGEPDSTWTEFPTKVLSANKWIDVSIKITGSTIDMEVRGKNFQKSHRNHILLPIHGDLFVAGHPSKYPVNNHNR